MTVIFPVHTRLDAGRLLAYDVSAPPTATAVLTPEVAYPVNTADGEVETHAAAPDLSRAVYATRDLAVCVDRDGRELWRLDFGPREHDSFVGRVACEFSTDGRLAWIYRPDAMAGRGEGLDHWLVVDVGSGAVLSEVELACAGHGGTHFPHPDGVHMLLDVGEGQDGSQVYRGRLTGTGIEVTTYEWVDARTLVSLAPDGAHFMTVQQEQEDVAFHTWPDGAEVVRVPVGAFGQEWGDAFVEWAGGYLDADTAVVTIVGEDEEIEEEWHRHHVVDVRTGEVRGVLAAPTLNSYDLEPLGDGSWLRHDEEGRLWRHRYGDDQPATGPTS